MPFADLALLHFPLLPLRLANLHLPVQFILSLILSVSPYLSAWYYSRQSTSTWARAALTGTINLTAAVEAAG